MGVAPTRFYGRSHFKNHWIALTESYLLVLKQLCFPQKHPAENLMKIGGWISLPSATGRTTLGQEGAIIFARAKIDLPGKHSPAEQ